MPYQASLDSLDLVIPYSEYELFPVFCKNCPDVDYVASWSPEKWAIVQYLPQVGGKAKIYLAPDADVDAANLDSYYSTADVVNKTISVYNSYLTAANKFHTLTVYDISYANGGWILTVSAIPGGAALTNGGNPFNLTYLYAVNPKTGKIPSSYSFNRQLKYWDTILATGVTDIAGYEDFQERLQEQRASYRAWLDEWLANRYQWGNLPVGARAST